jgi:hypothetical protein
VRYDLTIPKEPGTSEQSYDEPYANEFEASIPANQGAGVAFHRTHHNPFPDRWSAVRGGLDAIQLRVLATLGH